MEFKTDINGHSPLTSLSGLKDCIHELIMYTTHIKIIYKNDSPIFCLCCFYRLYLRNILKRYATGEEDKFAICQLKTAKLLGFPWGSTYSYWGKSRVMEQLLLFKFSKIYCLFRSVKKYHGKHCSLRHCFY